MSYRGKLIRPLVVELARLDTNATKTGGGYDPTFRTLKPGTARVELPLVRLHAQVEQGTYQQQNQTQAGNVPDSRVTCVFHFRELEALGLIDPATGDALIRVGDRLAAIYDRTGAKVTTYKTVNGGAYATKVEPAGLGLGGQRNLLTVTFEDRPQGLTNNP